MGYDDFAAYPAETLDGLREALAAVGLDPAGYDDMQLAASHAAIIGSPRPTVGTVVDGEVVLGPISSLDQEQWTPEVHKRVWPIVAEMHSALQETFAGVYSAPPRPEGVPAAEW